MSTISFEFPATILPDSAPALREEVRAFIAEERASGRIAAPSKIGMAFNPGFSRACGQRGYIGMTWPKRYGGGERSALERFVVTEEILSAGAPVRGHWTSDRQSGPVILRYGTDAQKDHYLPAIAAGEAYFCIGLSEADSGSDLASVKTRADRVSDGWIVNGAKLWTTNAHNCQYMIALCRTTPQDSNQRYHGLTQLIIDLSSPSVTVRPIINLAGEHDFNEVVMKDAHVPDSALLGTLDEGWKQVSAELAYERSGPERWLNAFRLLAMFNDLFAYALEPAHRRTLGRLFAHLVTLREMSLSIAGMLEVGKTPNLEASIVKDLGTLFEQEMIALVRNMAEAVGGNHPGFRTMLESAMLLAPAFTIRGGTTEILRSTIAKGLHLR